MSSLFDFLPDSFLKEEQIVLKGLLEAIATGDTFVIELLSQARRQLFLTTAEGGFLTNLANRYNFSVPPNSGLDQNSFRQLALPAIFAPKQSIPTFNKIIEVFYGTAVLHPVVSSTVSEPFSLQDRDTLIIETESGIFSVLFLAERFPDITNLSASQIASTINAQVPELYADIVTDKNTRRSSVRVVSKEFGIAAKIRVVGGAVQNKLKFQGYKDSCNLAGTEWNISHFSDAIYSKTIRFTWVGGPNPNLATVNVGDFISIYNLQDTSTVLFSKLNGTFEIVDCGYDYFEINSFEFPYTNILWTQESSNNFAITSQDFKTIFTNDQYAYITEATAGTVDISIPVIPPIIRKNQEGVSRFRNQSIQLLDIESNKLIIPYPNSLPESGVIAFESAKFLNGFIEKYYYYTNKEQPSGSTQALSIDSSIQNSTPFLSPVECQIAFEALEMTNPIGGLVDNSELFIHTPELRHNLENIEEVVFQDVNLDQPVFKHKTIKNIRIAPNADEVSFENGMETQLLYVQFADETTNEKYYFNYEPDPEDADNSTILKCIPMPDERFVRAIMCSMNPAVTPGEVTLSIGPNSFPNIDTQTTYTHNFNTPYTSFMMSDADTNSNLHGVRIVDNVNNVKFISAPHQSLTNVNTYVLDYQNVFPNFTRAVAINVLLPASPAGENSITVIHNLFSTNLITEIRIRPTPANTMGLLPNSIFEGPRIFFTDIGGIQSDTQFQLKYMNTVEDLRVDIFLMASYFNPVESVNGKLLRSDIDKAHKIKRIVNQERFIFEILGTGPAPYGSGTITTIGKNVTGVGTQFLTQVQPGDLLVLATGQNREVASIISNTKLRLRSGFYPSISTPTIYKVASPSANDAPLGAPIKYDGAWIYGFNVIFRPDSTRRTDIAFEFPDRISRGYANFQEGSIVKLLDFGFIPTSRYGIATYLKTIYLQVHSQEGKYVYFRSNIGIPLDYNPLDPNTWLIIRDGKCKRSGEFGGTEFKYYMQKPLSEWNRETFFKNAKLYLVSANVPENEYIVGSYLYDPVGTYSPYVISDKFCRLEQPIVAFESPGIVLIDGIDSLPSSGFVMINYGNSRQEGPIKYDLVIDGNPAQLKIDPAYVFKQSHENNSVVRVISQTSPPTIGIAGKEYPVYITGATQVRVTLQKTLEQLVSVGVKLNIQVQLPDLKYDDPGIAPFQA